MRKGRAFEPGVRLADRYRLDAALAVGGVGQVFDALDERLDRRVAVKVVRTPELASRTALARLEREARAAARVRHPSIVDVTDFGTTPDGFPYLVMDRLEGDTLQQVIEREGVLPISLAIKVHVQLLDALAAAHAASVLHRDVKPANVLLAELASGETLVTLLDFGLAALADAASTKLTDGGIVLGSPGYLPPERLLGEPADARSDVYSVGVCLYESLTGRRPFEAPSALVLRGRVLTESVISARTIRPDIPPELDSILMRALAKGPDERFQSAREMHDALDGLPRADAAPGWAGVERAAHPALVVDALPPPLLARAGPSFSARRWLVRLGIACAIVGLATWGMRTVAARRTAAVSARSAGALAPSGDSRAPAERTGSADGSAPSAESRAPERTRPVTASASSGDARAPEGRMDALSVNTSAPSRAPPERTSPRPAAASASLGDSRAPEGRMNALSAPSRAPERTRPVAASGPSAESRAPGLRADSRTGEGAVRVHRRASSARPPPDTSRPDELQPAPPASTERPVGATTRLPIDAPIEPAW